MTVQWLHAAQAPVRPRHCTQALLQQPDQLILSALTRSASRALLLNVRLRRMPRLPPLRASTSRRQRRRGFAEGLWHYGPESRNVNVREPGIGQRLPVMMSTDTTPPLLFALPFLMGVLGWL